MSESARLFLRGWGWGGLGRPSYQPVAASPLPDTPADDLFRSEA
jgi:hypothetical protein